MRRWTFLPVVLGTLAALLVAGCGSSEVTISGSQSGVTFSVVVSSDSTGISLVKQSVAQGTGGSAFTGTVTDGDNHTGNDICSFSASKNGHSYQVTVYATSLPSGITSSQLAALICNSSSEQAFTSALPNG